MMCQRIGLLPISIIGLGRVSLSSLIRVPVPPARITAFTRPEDNVFRWDRSSSARRTGRPHRRT